MKHSRILVALAVLLYLVAWFLPVIQGGTTLGQGGIPGWQALCYALSPLWERGAGMAWWQAAISVLSALTNGWFLLAIVGLRRGVVSDTALLSGLLLAAVVDAQWFVLSAPRSDLRIGYYLWTASFLVLAGALVRRRHLTPA